MKVVFFNHTSSLYGASRSLLNLIEGLPIHNIKSFVVAPDEGPLTANLLEKGVPVFIAPIQCWVGPGGPQAGFWDQVKWMARGPWRFRDKCVRMAKNFSVLPQLKNKLVEWDIDIIYSNSSVIPIGALAAKILKKPHVWHLREFGDLDYGLQFDWGKRIFHQSLRSSSAQICISKSIRDYYKQALQPDNNFIVYNGIATFDEFDRLWNKSQGMKNSCQETTFALVGLLHPNKGQDQAIKALAQIKDLHPKAKLLLAGEGKEGPLRNLATALGVGSRVEFLGYVNDPYQVYFQADAVLMCSKNEAMGRVTVEAMSACRPVIGLDQGGTSELIDDGVTGLLYRGDAEDLANCMRRILENPNWARTMGEAGWRSAREKFTTEIYCRKISSVLRNISTR